MTKQTKPLDRRAHTACQMCVEYFGQPGIGQLEYSTFASAPCWNGYVGWIAEAGAMLDDRMSVASKGGDHIDEWYDVMEAAAESLFAEIREHQAEPDWDRLREIFDSIIARFSESGAA